jgi:bifunctional enzyme CysN/CysC
VRKQVAEVIGENSFFMVYIDADINYCRKNDAYGLYKKAENGEISHLPGIDMKFDAPTSADIIYFPEKEDINPEKVIELLAEKGVFSL